MFCTTIAFADIFVKYGLGTMLFSLSFMSLCVSATLIRVWRK